MSKPIKDIETINKIKEMYIKKNKKRDLLLFLLAINTGLKLNDLLNLNVKDVKEKEYIEIKQELNNKDKNKDKNKKQQKNEIPVNKTIQKLIKEITNKRKPKEPLFISNFGGRLDRTLVYKTFKEIINELNLKKDEKSSYSPSSWRKTFGYHYYQKYKDLSFLQYLFSQQTINETIKYIEITNPSQTFITRGMNL